MSRLTASQRKAQARRSTGWCRALGGAEPAPKGSHAAARIAAIMDRLPDPPPSARP